MQVLRIFWRRVIDEVRLFFRTYPHLSVYCLALGGFLGFIVISGYACPIRYFFGIPCPGCGIMRALDQALLFHFEQAFEFHPLWILVPPVLGLVVLFDVKNWNRAMDILFTVGGILMVAVYLYRIFILKSPVVAIDFRHGKISNFIIEIFEHFAK